MPTMTNRGSTDRRGVTLIELIVVFVIIGGLLALLMPAINRAREAANRTKCASNLHQIGLAMKHYVTVKRRYPPAAVAGTIGGWAIEILPFLEDTQLSLNLTETQLSSPAALAFAKFRPAIMCCPGGYAGDSDIAGVPPSHYTADINHDVVNSLDRTVFRRAWSVMDVPTDMRTAWVLSPEGRMPRDVSSWSLPHSGGWNVASAEGDVHFGSLSHLPLAKPSQ